MVVPLVGISGWQSRVGHYNRHSLNKTHPRRNQLAVLSANFLTLIELLAPSFKVGA
jgi:hypothetical protein